MLTPQRVYDYFWLHFEDLPPYEQFHFAHRLFQLKKNERAATFFRQLALKLQTVSEIEQWQLLHGHLTNKTPVADQERSEYLAKHPLIREVVWDIYIVLFGKSLFELDFSSHFNRQYSRKSIKKLYFSLRNSSHLLALLSTFAVNFLILSNYIFEFEPQPDLVKFLVSQTTQLYSEPENMTVIELRRYLYYVTHLVIASTLFYQLPVTEQQRVEFQPLFITLETVIKNRFNDSSLDVRLEFLVCAELLTFPVSAELIQRVSETAASSGAANGDYSVEPGLSNDPQKNEFVRSEHRNVFYLLAFYDQIERL